MNKINKHTYEYYVIDYIEGNLSAELTKQMGAFLQAHPDIALSIKGLEKMQLNKQQQESIPASALASLHSQNICLSTEDNTTIQLEADINVIYPHKAKLYQRKRPIALWWYPATVAAASLLLFLLWRVPPSSQRQNQIEIAHIADKTIKNIEPLALYTPLNIPNLYNNKQLTTKIVNCKTPSNTANNTPTANAHSEKLLIAQLPMRHPHNILQDYQQDIIWQGEIDMLFASQSRRNHLQPRASITRRKRTFARISKVLWRLTKTHTQQMAHKVIHGEDYAYEQANSITK